MGSIWSEAEGAAGAASAAGNYARYKEKKLELYLMCGSVVLAYFGLLHFLLSDT